MAGRSGSKATKQAAVVVTITVCVCALNADVAVEPLASVTANVWFVPSLNTLLMSIISFTLDVGWGYFEILVVWVVQVSRQ